jgi:hypothetical protein
VCTLRRRFTLCLRHMNACSSWCRCSPYGPEVIEAQLRGVLAEPLSKAKESAVGSLTTLDRDSWAQERAVMEKNGFNKSVVSSSTCCGWYRDVLCPRFMCVGPQSGACGC